MQYLQQACDWGTFKKPDAGYPAGPIIVGKEGKIWFLHLLHHQKIQISKPGNYSIVDKSTSFVHFCYPYVKHLNFASFLHKYQQLFFFKKKKKRILVKTRKTTCLFTVNKYLHQLPWVDCATVELSQTKNEFQNQDVFQIKPWQLRP